MPPAAFSERGLRGIMEFEKGQKVWAREKTYCPSGWKEFLEKYPDRIFVIDSMSCGQMSPDRYFSFNPSDLSPIYHYKGMRLVEEGGEERKLQKDEYVIWKSGEVSRWIGPEESSSKHKILIPLPLPEKEVKEMETKYEVIPFTPHDFMQARQKAHGNCDDEQFRKDYRWLVSIMKYDPWSYVDSDNDIFLAGLDSHPCMKEHMLNKYNMIREVKEPERAYHVGQRFKCNILGLEGKIYKLIRVNNNQIALYCAEFDSAFNRKSYIVKETHKITPAEFSEICGGKPEDFTLIEE